MPEGKKNNNLRDSNLHSEDEYNGEAFTNENIWIHQCSTTFEIVQDQEKLFDEKLGYKKIS
jgi:hypothetical protein